MTRNPQDTLNLPISRHQRHSYMNHARQDSINQSSCCPPSTAPLVLYNTIVVLGTAAARKAIQSARSSLRTLSLNAFPLPLTAGLSHPASEPPSCCSARPLRLRPPSTLHRSALANPRTHRRAGWRVVYS